MSPELQQLRGQDFAAACRWHHWLPGNLSAADAELYRSEAGWLAKWGNDGVHIFSVKDWIVAMLLYVDSFLFSED